MPYYEIANLVTVTKTNMTDEIHCAYGTLHVASGPIYILLMYPINPFRCMVTVGHYATFIVYNGIPTKWEDTAKQRSEGNMQCNASSWCRLRSSLPPGCLWWLWRSASTLAQPVRPDGNVFCWWALWDLDVVTAQKIWIRLWYQLRSWFGHHMPPAVCNTLHTTPPPPNSTHHTPPA